MEKINNATSAVLDLILLRTFVEVVDSGSFVLAAERLALTPSTVSGHIKRLEQSVDAMLLARTTRRLELTQAGETLHVYANNLLGMEREAQAKLRGKAIQGRLCVGASEDFAGTWLASALHTFNRWHPQSSIELKVGITSDLLREQTRGRLDVVFGKQCDRVDGTGELLWEEPLVWAYASTCELDLSGEIPLALFPEPCVYRESALTALNGTARAWRLVFESSSMAGCLSAALSGFAVTVIARSQMRDGLREIGEEQLPKLPAARFYAYPNTLSNAISPASSALIKAVRQIGQRSKFMAAR
ncbi:MAG: LysR family transcriptional regulator [Pseudomonadota bacterium]